MLLSLVNSRKKVISFCSKPHAAQKEEVPHSKCIQNSFLPLCAIENPTVLNRVLLRPLKHISLLNSVFLYCSPNANEMF